ncbi:MAG: hypothetical protein UT61_C0002G0012 [Candidatus Woesebacteria bacterium GW2011_GWA1_39_8]|uniref:Activator of Hsp90 ATPase homologue 1/2-like C-terminal domain-containing protein n=1 Tax=Candidatus Woesebacteria bacterium GW2011_GWA1_39_8 TaxID=1618552 RepID=A0A0G0PS85_9BACT|nr:MAG: hypothetical protein UT61_C0002G0012 [Candidatus Woesebacteria bacterium GW2011_GWA1_39_8]
MKIINPSTLRSQKKSTLRVNTERSRSIKKEYHIWVPQSEVWNALVNPETIQKWGEGKANMSEKVGVKFSLWDGQIHGTNLEVIPQKKLVQEWYSSDDPDHVTKVTFTLTHKDGCTALYLKHEGVREKNYDSIDKGWDDYYLGEIKKLLEKK